MTKFITSLLFVLTLIFIFSCKKKVFPEEGKYKITIDSIRKSTTTSDYDTIWFTVSPQDGKKTIVRVSGYTNDYGYANPKIVNATDKYLVLDRNIQGYNNSSRIRIAVLAYGSAQSYDDVPYLTTTKTTNNSQLSGKILFKTNSNWVLWDLKANKVISTASSSLEVVDYNSTTGKILVKSGSYLYYYNEDFTTYKNYYIANLSSNASNLCFNGTSNSVSYFDAYDNFGHQFTPPSTNSTTQLEYYYYYMYQFNASQNAQAHVMYSSSSYYYLRYSINSGLYQTASYASSNSFNNIEISNDGKYLLYTYNSKLTIYNTSTLSTIDLANYSYYKPCFDNTFTKVSFIDLSNRLTIYDIQSGGTSYPLYNTSYGIYNIYQAYW